MGWRTNGAKPLASFTDSLSASLGDVIGFRGAVYGEGNRDPCSVLVISSPYCVFWQRDSGWSKMPSRQGSGVKDLLPGKDPCHGPLGSLIGGLVPGELLRVQQLA
jgi:hypothetical protein